jgi:hypothetical protein
MLILHMLILFDQNVPRQLRRLLPGHLVRVSADLGWGQIKNGTLLGIAEEAGYDLMVTGDQNIRYQQNLTGRKIAILALGSNRWTLVRNHLPAISEAVNAAEQGSYAFIEIPVPPRPKYKPTP